MTRTKRPSTPFDPRKPDSGQGRVRRQGLSHHSIAWLVVTLLFVLLALLTIFAGREREEAARLTQQLAGLPDFDLQGHRGARGLYPENSLAGFEAALAIGVTTLELDLVMSADGRLLVHHDARLAPERTRDPSGAWLDPEAASPRLLDLTAAKAGAYDVGRLRPGSEAAARFPAQEGLDGVAIPTLREVLARAEALSGGRIRYNLETKLSPLRPEESATPEAYAEALAALLRETGLTERATVQSFDWRTLALLRDLAPEIRRVHLTAEQPWLDSLERGQAGASPWLGGLDVDDFGASPPVAVAAAGGAVWSPYFRDLRPADLAEAHRLGLKVVVWTVNGPAEMAALLEDGVDGIITDYPDRLRAVMAERGLPLPPRYRP